MKLVSIKMFCVSLGLATLLSAGAYASDTKLGKLKMYVSPQQAYTFVDGQAMGPGNCTIDVSPGNHTVLVANYGYKFVRRDISVEPGATVGLDITLEPFGDAVVGPRGRIQIESGHWSEYNNEAVLLNGKTPDYFVGHVDEFNNDIIWHQELIVPPGSHMVTVTRYGKEVWTGTVNVGANERVIVDMSNNKIRVKPWDRGEKLGALQRFRAGIASATVAVAPVTGAISVNPTRIDCGQQSQLAWNSAEAIDANISGMSPVPVNGEQFISPKQTTTYNFTATGPGGVANSSATVYVNPEVQSSLNASQPEARYRRIGDKVIEQNTVTLNWSASNAESASLSHFGAVENSGSKSFVIVPSQTANGPVDETFHYALDANNICGGTATKMVSVHLAGSIEPIPDVLLHSAFFPTDYPLKADPSMGLLQSQQAALTSLAKGFTQYLEYDPDAKLALDAYADERGTDQYNQALSERRAKRVMDFLISQGVPSVKISFTAHGENQPLDKTEVLDLQKNNPEQPTASQMSYFETTWLAYNRRVDVILIPTKHESVRFFPHSAPDSEILWQRMPPEPKTVAENQ